MENIDFGVCRLSLVSVRHKPSDQSEQVTQLLFGDHYEVLEESDGWLRIRIHFDQYDGWIDKLQHHSIPQDYFDYLDRAEFKITTDLTSTLLHNKSPLAILMGSIIPISSSELFKMEEQFAFNGEAKNVGQKREFEYLRTVAMKYINAPYQWGGKSPFGIDCSGFTQMVFKIAGYKLSRDSGQQALQGKPVKSFDEARPGDLAFFKNSKDKISHVGILLSDEKIIHASGRVRIDSITEEGIPIPIPEIKFYSHELAFVRRILPES